QVAGRNDGEGQGRQATFQEKMERVIAARRAARKANDFARADEIRAELGRAGITLEDTPTETFWRAASTPKTRGGA
ncbi:MAG: hypothetical protein QF792_08425, partial [Phycisphaerae bacterium]|nr:hypothetical protein [Phycisphaerae bacterium]